MVDVAGDAAGADPHRPLRRVDAHALHHRQIDNQPIIDAGEARPIVGAAANGDGKLAVPAEIHRRDHIGDVGAAGDQQRPLVDHRVVELSRLVVIRMVAPDDRAAKTLREFGDGFVVHHAISPKAMPIRRPD